ncbi:PTS system mannose/fructose/N-acetylgalactosamine-transporter subunit IIB [Zhaonella formicivorans]|uniref:PTS system mannose/fructose/N-acetylgalactosamine-transporter subunit IIB n=1 Tax=Zhaonella formicivorans TaxID=2528593 RepID=UPI0010E9ECD5|nr:PTS sugar transporter subunit IIB [Zhaonella formicivorans]
MDVVLYRIDDRLIHGQVMTAWSKLTSANHVIIVDDSVVADPFMCKILSMAAPSGMKVEILNVDDGIKRLKGPGEGTRVIVLFKVPQVVLKLIEAGIKISNLNVGGMGAAPGRKPLFKNISASPAEIETLKKIDSLGTKIEFRIVPDDKSIPFDKVIKK